MDEQQKYNRLLELLSRTGPLTDEELGELMLVWADPPNAAVRPHMIGMFQGRMVLELIRSLRTFDRASRDLVRVTNRLTRWILGLAILAATLAAANVAASGWPYLTWWIKHGFAFH